MNFLEQNRRYEQNLQDFKEQQDEADWLRELDSMGLLPAEPETEEEAK